MKPLKNPWSVFGKVALILGLAFSTVSIIIFILNDNQLSEATKALGINGIVWGLIGLLSYLYYKVISIKLRRLKTYGLEYDAKIVQLRISPFIHIGGYITVNAECTYQNLDGKICLVKSRLFLHNCPKDDLKAIVYVDRYNPLDYSVEIFANQKNSGSYDYDYR